MDRVNPLLEANLIERRSEEECHRRSEKSAADNREHDERDPEFQCARVALHTTAPLFFDSYKKNRQTGAMILIDESANATVAAGLIL